MFYPTLKKTERSQDTVSAFYGYNHTLRIDNGEFFDMENMSASAFPVLSPRDARGIVAEIEGCRGLCAKDALCWVFSDNGVDKLKYSSYDMSAYVSLDNANHCGDERTFISMGAYIVVFPDKVYFNTQDFSDAGSLENRWANAAAAEISYCLAGQSGESITVSYTQDAQPSSPENGQHWLDTSRTPHTLRQYSQAGGVWSEVSTACVKISAPSIGSGFSRYDGVRISGCAVSASCGQGVQQQVSALNTDAVIYACDDNSITVAGILDEACVQQAAAGAVKIERTVPDMDYVTQCGNRIWGCRYGISGGRAVNEIICCVQGDFKNWSRYLGISTDSYSASRGSDGPWTGAASFLGCPLFFKENCIEKVFPSSSGAHQIVTAFCRGVQKGCAKSLVNVDNVLYYKSAWDVCAYDGALPVSVSAALGDEKYSDACAGRLGSNYYISLKDTAGLYSLFVYDCKRGMWHRHDSTQAVYFAELGTELYGVILDSGVYTLTAMSGSQGAIEPTFDWYAETGNIGLAYPGSKYMSRFNIRLMLEKGAGLDVYAQYDSDGVWRHCGSMCGAGALGTFTVPAPPVRCDHMRLRLSGYGGAKIYSFTKLFEKGGDA